MACAAHIISGRSLKRTKLGPPDVYPQLADQKEDKLNDLTLKKGFSNPPVTQNECGSAREKVKAKGLSALQQNILNSSRGLCAAKRKLSTVTDNGSRKIQTISRDQFWSVNPRSNRVTIKKFWTDLANCSKSLASLVKGRIPSFQKKEEVLDWLADYQVPLMRAVWFMKITAVHVASISKKRNTCVALEWTRAITEYVKDNLAKFAEQSQEYKNNNTLTTGNKAMAETYSAKNRWSYCLRLAHYMYQEGLLDKQEFLLFLIKWIYELKTAEKEDMMKYLIQVMLTYLDDVTQNFVLSRTAAYLCVHKLNELIEVKSERSTFEWDSAVKDCHVPVRSNCPYHDSLLLIFSTVLQRITLYCPTALVWQYHWISPFSGSDGTKISKHKESPLDNLQCYPASLPFPRANSSEQVDQLRYEISENTEDIRVRSIISEERWILGEDNTPPSVIPMLNTLDEHNFHTAQPGGSVTAIYSKVFGPVTKQLNEQLKDDAPIVAGLCEWAVTHKRTGSHRALVVAEFLKKRQADLLKDRPKKEEFLFQNILFKYLNEDAPTWSARLEDREQFNNCTILFGELVRSQCMFDYMKYLTKLISRGDLPCSKINMVTQQDFTILCTELHTLPRHIQYVLSLPIQDKTHKDELKQRSSLLFGVGIQAHIPLEYINKVHKELRIIYYELSSNPAPFSMLKQHSGVIERFKLLPAVYKYMITPRLAEHAMIRPSVSTQTTLPTVHQIEFIYLLMELSGDVRTMMALSIDMLQNIAALKKHGVIVPLNIYLCVTAVLKQYQTSLFISDKDTHWLYTQLAHMTDNSNDVCAAEKCIFIYRQELYKASINLNTNREEPCTTKYTSPKQKLKSVPATISKHSASFQSDVEHPGQADINAISQKIGNNESLGQSFISTVVHHVCTELPIHQLPDLVDLCAELTTRHTYLEAVWVAAINNPHCCGDIPTGPSWWSVFSLFIILLLRYQCFSLWRLMYCVIYPSLYDKFRWPINYHKMHLLLALFTQVEYPEAESLDLAVISHSAFRHLDAERRTVKPSRFATILKLLIRSSTTPQDLPSSHKHLEPLAVLKSICSQVWVPELCLSTPEKLVDNYLVDKEISPDKAQLLLHLICNPRSPELPSTDSTELVNYILKNMDKWTMRSSHLEVRLIRVLSRDNANEGDEQTTLKIITDAVVSTLGEILSDVAKSDCRNSTLWLIPTFINKLHDQVKEHLIQWLGEWLGEGSWWDNDFTFCESTSWHQPLLSLMTGCLNNNVTILQPNLMNQLRRFVDEVKGIDKLTEKQAEQLNTALHLRVSLVGAQFHLITSSLTSKIDWGILLLRLVRHPAVDPTRLGEGILFYSLLDMLSTIVEQIEVSCMNSDDTCRTMNFKKICADTLDVENPVNSQVKQLLKIPLYKESYVIVEHTSLNEEWQQRQVPQYEQMYPEMELTGYIPVGKHYLSPWELVEGQKGGCNVAPWQELGGVKCDKQLLKMEERLAASLRGHTHAINPLEHEQVSIPATPKTETLGHPLMGYPNRPQMMGAKPRMMRPTQHHPQYSAIMGAPAPNVTITQQGPVQGFNPHEVPAQYPFEGGSGNVSGNNPQFVPSQQQPGQQQQPMFESNFIDNNPDMHRGPMARGSYSARMMRPQLMAEQQKRQFLESQQKLRMQQPGMIYQQQQPPPYLHQQQMSNTGMPNIETFPQQTMQMSQPSHQMNQPSHQMNQPSHQMNQPSHQFMHQTQMQGGRATMSLPVSMSSLQQTGPRMMHPTDPTFSKPLNSYFDQQFN